MKYINQILFAIMYIQLTLSFKVIVIGAGVSGLSAADYL